MVTSAEELLVEQREDGICVVTLNRPHKLNAVTDELHKRLAALFWELDDAVNLHAVIVTGAGRAFCAGADTSEERDLSDIASRRRVFRTGRRLLDALLSLHIPVIAAVNGPAVGLGASIATACDLVVMSDEAFFADTHVPAGLVAGDGGAVTWTANLGLLRAKEYLLTGDRLTADKALDFGLANRVVEASRLMPEALALAGRIAAMPPQAVQDTKALLNQQLRSAAVPLLGEGLASELLSQYAPSFREDPFATRSTR
jgi:enoyl-CoA hydratase